MSYAPCISLIEHDKQASSATVLGERTTERVRSRTADILATLYLKAVERLGSFFNIDDRAPVQSTVTRLLEIRLCAGYETYRPALKLVWRIFSESLRLVKVVRDSANSGADPATLAQSPCHQVNGQGLHVNAYPAAAKSCCAASTAVPQPQKGSSTRSPGLLLALIIRSSNAKGFCVGYPRFSF